MALEHPHLAEGPPRGQTLAELVAKSGPLSQAKLLRLAGELSQALSYLHASGKRHGALTPEAICLRPDGSAFLALDAPAPKDAAGWIPFEQASDKPVPASDLYQLGATLLFAGSGREPSEAGLPTAWRGDASLEGALGRLIAGLVDPRWDRRPSSAAVVAQDCDDITAGRSTRGQRRRHRASAAGLAGLLAITGATYGWLARGSIPIQGSPTARVERIPRVGPTATPILTEPDNAVSGWTQVRDLYPDVMGLQRGQTEGVWVFTKYEAALLPDGAPNLARKTLHDILIVTKSKGPTKEGSVPYRPSYAAGVGVGEEAFTGGWEGEVLRGTLSGASLPKPPSLGENGRVDDMAWSEGTLYAAWRGRLWAWREGAAAWAQPGGHPPTNVKAILVSRTKIIYAGGSSGLWRQDASAWTQVWKGDERGDERGDEIVALAEDAQGRVLAGTNSGFITVTAAGETLSRELGGHRVTSFAEGGDGRLWAGTWDAGIFVRESGTWRPFGFAYGLPADNVAGVVVDRHNLLWVGIYGSGVVVRPEAEAAAAARAAKAPERLPGDIYDSLEDAAGRNIIEGKPSGAVARLSIGGHNFVYFDGRQVAPTGPGSLAADGTSARRENGSWILRRPDGAETVLPTPPAVGSYISRSLIDHAGRLYLGTENGILLYDAGAWRTLGLEAGLDANPVQDLAEDKAGNLWATTSPAYNREQGKYLRKNLHRFDGKSWTSWSPDDGLGYWSSFAVRPLPDGSVAAATNGGLSVVHAGRVRNYGRDDGLSDPAWSWISADSSGHIVLVGFSDGLALCDNFKFSRVTTRQGLFSNDLTAAAIDKDGRVWLLARDGRAFVAGFDTLRAAAK